MVQEETSIAEKIMKHFPRDNIVLNKKFNNRKPENWFKNHKLIIQVMKIMSQMMKKKDKTCLKYITLKLLGNFLGKIIFYVTKLLKKVVKK